MRGKMLKTGMWQADRRKIAEPQGEILSITGHARALAAGDVIALWRDNAAFRDFFITELAAAPFAGFFWELPPLAVGTLESPFECAVIRSDALSRVAADGTDFASHLRGEAPVSVFPNLGGDALLIAPRRMSDADCYGHIAAFLRAAPRGQRHALLRCLAEAIGKRLAETSARFWVSTSGLGVAWVHLRLDSWPKYYQYVPYRNAR
jgi:hypothetical protein